MNGVAVLDRATLDCIFSGFKRYPQKGEELLAENFSVSLGGGACVAPIRLSKMGIPARYGTFLGDDILSTAVKKLLSDLDFHNIHNFYKGEKNPVIFSAVFSGKDDRGILTYDSGAFDLSDDEMYGFFKGADICFAPKNEAVLKKLHADGTVILYDSHWEEGQTLADYIPTLRYADFFTPNNKEAMALTETDSAEEALRVLSEYTKNPIVKVGKKGCIAEINGEIRYFPTIDVNTVDTTGAGDNFLTGLCFGIYHKFPLEKCIRLANVAGALSTEASGCFAAEYDLNDWSEK